MAGKTCCGGHHFADGRLAFPSTFRQVCGLFDLIEPAAPATVASIETGCSVDRLANRTCTGGRAYPFRHRFGRVRRETCRPTGLVPVLRAVRRHQWSSGLSIRLAGNVQTPPPTAIRLFLGPAPFSGVSKPNGGWADHPSRPTGFGGRRVFPYVFRSTAELLDLIQSQPSLDRSVLIRRLVVGLGKWPGASCCLSGRFAMFLDVIENASSVCGIY